MWTQIKAAYRDSWSVALKFPLLFALPAAAEISQHVVEYKAGMFASIAGMRAAADDSSRMGFGIVKVLTLFLLIYWMTRALAAANGARLHVLGDTRSALLFAGVLAWSLGAGWLQLFGGGLLSLFIPSAGAIIAIGAVYVIVVMVIDTYLAAWKAGASLGNARLTVPASFRIMRGNFWWSFGFFWAIYLPGFVLHYLLNGLAVGRAPAIQWPILIVDGLVVGFLGLVGAATVYIMAGRAAARGNVALAP